ncbi:hypothetical protein ACA29_12220 [Lederbergia galactosidilytica]|uniref:Peptidase S74 domain-containing protein n=1 Tax=Lederbergia galactosidilytica TaxID=217031 RepID=A0A0Q9XUU0_9BACI|nr:hypothetical protein ACA29_12220 [Lederbergia galactosidilytica]
MRIQLGKGNKLTDWSPAPEDMATDTQFSRLEQTVDSISGQITKKLDSEIYDSFVQQTEKSLSSKISQGVYDNNNKIIDERFSSVTQTVSGVQTQVNDNKKNISTVTQLANGLQTRLSNAEGSISTLTQTATSLQSTIKGVRDDLDGLEIGGTNILIGTTSEIRTRTFSGWSDFVSNSANLNIPIEPGETYTFRAYIESDKNNSVNVGVMARLMTSPGNGNTTGRKEFSDLTIKPGEKGYSVITFTVPSGFHYLNPFTIRANSNSGSNGSNQKVSYKNEKLEIGSKATDWSPAVEDMATQSQISQLATDINLRVKKGDTITQINIDGQNSSVLIDGKYVHITGQTKIDNGVIKTLMVADGTIINSKKIGNLAVDSAKLADASVTNAKIKSLRADKIDGGIINGNSVTVKVTNGKQELRLDDTGLESVDSNGNVRIHLGVRNLAGKGQSDPSTLRFFSGSGSVSAGVGMNVNDTFVIGSSSDKVAMEFYSGKNTINYGQRFRFVPHDIDSGQYLDVFAISNTGGQGKEICLRSPIANTGYIGSVSYPFWRVYSANIHETSTIENKTNISDCTVQKSYDVISSLDIKRYQIKGKNGNGVGEWKFGIVAEEAPEEILDDTGKAVSLYSFISHNANVTQDQIKIIDSLKEQNEQLVLKIASLEERLNKLEAA